MREAPVDLEDLLDGLIARLSRSSSAKSAKALLVDARRLRAVVGKWQTIAPTDAAREEMAQRVAQLARSVDAAMEPGSPREVTGPPPREVTGPPPRESAHPSSRESAHPSSRDGAQPPQRGQRRALDAGDDGPLYGRVPDRSRGARPSAPDPVHARSAPPMETAPPAAAAPVPAAPVPAAPVPAAPVPAAPLDPIRPRTLPDLDISGIAELLDDGGHGLGAETPLAPRAQRPRIGQEPGARGRPSTTPPQGRRRADSDSVDRSGTTDRQRTGRHSRPSRFLIDPDADDDDGGRATGPVYPDEPAAQRLTPRPTPRPSSPPARPDKTPIAVRPLPAPEATDKRIVLLSEPYSDRADAYRTLRRKLSGPGSPKTIAVTSAQPGEGKTTCAVNLALAFRETSSEKVLLIEANLRAPALAKLFGFEPPVCFAKQMARNRDSQRASWTVVEQFEPLHVLAVDPASKTSPLLDPVAFANALEQLVEAGYDHIIVDTPPALGGADVNLIADAVDGVVVAAWIKKSKMSLIKKAIEQLKPATILGVVTLEG